MLNEIASEADTGEPLKVSELPISELIDRILTRYHEPLREELPRLLAMARKVEAVHGSKESCPSGLSAHLAQVHAEVEAHLKKEECILFPMIRGGQPAYMPVQVMTKEHDDHANSLRKTRELTNDFQPPPEACTTWRALFIGLSALEQDLMQHIHLENYVLFPRALNQPNPGGGLPQRSWLLSQ